MGEENRKFVEEGNKQSAESHVNIDFAEIKNYQVKSPEILNTEKMKRISQDIIANEEQEGDENEEGMTGEMKEQIELKNSADHNEQKKHVEQQKQKKDQKKEQQEEMEQKLEKGQKEEMEQKLEKGQKEEMEQKQKKEHKEEMEQQLEKEQKEEMEQKQKKEHKEEMEQKQEMGQKQVKEQKQEKGETKERERQKAQEHEQKQNQHQEQPKHEREQTQRTGKAVSESEDRNLQLKYSKLPTVIIVIGMAGSGKTTYVGSLYNYLKVIKKKKVYTMNLDPAVKYIHYPANIDIRDSIKYGEIMKEYKLGPNGAIMTCLNLFATRFDKVIELLEKRKNSLHYIIVDTPGQIEVFNWSASGNIILETLSVSFPVIINYVIDTVRCERPVTFMSNMLYACSVLYKSRLPLLACFNKIDIIKHDKCIEWMKNFDSFNEDVLNDVSYMASFSRSCALMLNEFYEEIKTVGVSSTTSEGFQQILKNLELLKQEYIDDFVPKIERQLKRIKRKRDKEVKGKMDALQKHMVATSNNTNIKKEYLD